jgi:hypothetical protein
MVIVSTRFLYFTRKKKKVRITIEMALLYYTKLLQLSFYYAVLWPIVVIYKGQELRDVMLF